MTFYLRKHTIRIFGRRAIISSCVSDPSATICTLDLPLLTSVASANKEAIAPRYSVAHKIGRLEVQRMRPLSVYLLAVTPAATSVSINLRIGG